MNWFLFLFLILVCIFFDIKKRNRIVYFLYIILFLSIGFREGLGWDYDTYKKFYEEPTLGLSKHFGEYFTFYITILKNLKMTSQALFLFTTFFKVLVVVYISNKLLKKYRTLPLFFYMINTFLFARDLGNLRQSIGETLYILFIYIYIIRKRKKGILYQIGGLFHNSFFLANIYLFLGIILKKIKKEVKIYMLIIVMIISYTLKNKILFLIEYILNKISPKYVHYLFTDTFGNFYNLKTLGYIIPLTLLSIIAICAEDKINKNKTEYIVFENIYYLSILSLWGVSFLPSTISRVTYYPMQVYIFLFPLLLENKKNSIKKILVLIIMMILSIGFIVEFAFGEKSSYSSRNRELRYNFKIYDYKNN